MTRRKTAPVAPTPVLRVDELPLSPRITIRKGDTVRVTGLRGTFRFVAVATHTENGSTWVELVGPASNPRDRAFRLEQIRHVPRRRTQ